VCLAQPLQALLVQGPPVLLVLLALSQLATLQLTLLVELLLALPQLLLTLLLLLTALPQLLMALSQLLTALTLLLTALHLQLPPPECDAICKCHTCGFSQIKAWCMLQHKMRSCSASASCILHSAGRGVGFCGPGRVAWPVFCI
jgi:hypothetical protein